jgi:hypothetical protein
MMDPMDRKAIERIKAGGLTSDERAVVYRAEHGLLTDEDRAALRREAEGFFRRNRWLIRRRRLAALLWRADEGMPAAWFYGRWIAYGAVVLMALIWIVRRY